jgi:nicotinate-nucleotide--dimethylbenzimidazole phosphoribosyltransferase
MNFITPSISSIHDIPLAAQLQARIDGKTKPLGALGRLESLALQLGLIQRSLNPMFTEPQLVVFAADHGLAARGVSAYPSDVTWQMVENFLAGGAAVSVLARQHGLALTVVDGGVRHDFPPRAGLLQRKVASGTADSSAGAAMTADECTRALHAGADVVRGLPGNALLLGEMGIGNTSSAALIMSRLCGEPIATCSGRGTGLDDASLARKRAVLQEVLSLHANATEPLDVLAAFGGFEIAMMAGAALQAASERRVVVVDGFICGAAVLDYCVFAHRSDEAGHALMLRHLQVQPLLELGMRLGEGSGGALAWPLLVSATVFLRDMASFESAGVSTRD